MSLLDGTGTQVHTPLYITQGWEGAPSMSTSELQSVKLGRMRFGEHEEEGTARRGCRKLQRRGPLNRFVKVKRVSLGGK